MARVLVPLTVGCEELEAVTIIDLLRRGGIEVVTAGLQAGVVKASRGTQLMPDTTLEAALLYEYDMVVLPGGMPGAQHLKDDARIITLLKKLGREHGTAVMLVTHDMGVIAETADRVAVIYAGRVVENASVREIFNAMTQRRKGAKTQRMNLGLASLRLCVNSSTTDAAAWFAVMPVLSRLIDSFSVIRLAP